LTIRFDPAWNGKIDTCRKELDPLRRIGDRILSLVWPRPATTLAERTRRRVSLHLVPYLFFLYILAYLDRVNVSVANLGMMKPVDQEGLGFDKDIVGFGFGVFFLGYWILEIPSTVSVVRWGARWVFVRILILWGLCASLLGVIGLPLASAFFHWIPHLPEQALLISSVDGFSERAFGWLVHLGKEGSLSPLLSAVQFVNGLHDTPRCQFYFFRFMLGFFEGGFFPSVIVYLTHWFRPEDRAKAIASFMAAIPLSSFLGMPLSGLLLEVRWLGLAGWRWIFILEGILPIMAGFATLFFLPDRPARARWLPAEERDWLIAELEAEHRLKQAQRHGPGKHFGLVLLLTAAYFCLNYTSYGLASFMPAIIQRQTGTSDKQASALSGLVYLVALVAMLVNGWHSDRTRERIWHAAVPLALMGAFVFLAALVDRIAVLPVLVMILCLGPCMYAHLPAFWPLPTMFLGSTAAAAAIGFINMIGNLGGSLGPTVAGKVAQGKNSFAPALAVLGPGSVAASGIVLVIAYLAGKHLAVPLVRAPGKQARAEKATGCSSAQSRDLHIAEGPDGPEPFR
jgi:MFS transporter, ACS family, tartrate transporter